ncbi:MAG: hypothetical protein EHM36_05620 [Deltaproteobacteria bacterium]|nr:MAG: hypothetical protein EHM36_05620 [Deltaproteobacteria bacterium]
MKGKICLSLVGVLSLFIFMTPAWAQYDIAGWWSGKATYEQGDFVLGDWVNLEGRGKKASYLYIFQETSNAGTAHFLIWDDETLDYLLETYSLYIRNGICVLYIPTFFDPTTGAPAGSTIVLKPNGSPFHFTSMKGHYTLFDMEATGTTDLFVRMATVMFNRVFNVELVPQKAKEKVPFP